MLTIPVSNHVRFNWLGISNGLVLIRYTIEAFDYSLYDEVSEILNQHGLKELSDWVHIYTNFKEAEIHSGRGVRARNSLVYNYKFGFDSKVCVVGFKKIIQNPRKIKRVAGNNFKEEFWNKCIGCDACREVCPVGAIHNNESVNWLDSSACDNFLSYSDHPRVPSMKKYWHENVHPEIPKELVDSCTTTEKNWQMGDGDNCFIVFDVNGYSADHGVFYKNGKEIAVPICRECQVQAPCSKWNAQYPYEKELEDMDTLKEDV